MIYISIGSNKGNRLEQIRVALGYLKTFNLLNNIETSIIIETKAVIDYTSPKSWHSNYLNIVVRGNTNLSPEFFLERLLFIELSMGRTKDHLKWSPRIIDLDILLWNNIILNLSNLKVPHKELFNRPFLLHMIASIDPEYQYIADINSKYYGMSFGEIASQYLQQSISLHFIRSMVLAPKFVGIVNVTPDSFSDGGKFSSPNRALRKVISFIKDGASIVEIGAQSTRPQANILNYKDEWKRLKPVLDRMYSTKSLKSFNISVDTFYSEIVLEIINNYPISCFNDVLGKIDNRTLSLIASKGCSIVVMHSLSIPPDKDKILNYDQSSINLITTWLRRRIEKLLSLGFTKKQIIIDPGIGFGKSYYQNIILLKKIKALKKLNCPVLVGHSRKSYINTFAPDIPLKKRDLETISISQHLASSNVDYLRVHDVRGHQRFFVAYKSILGKVKYNE